MTRLDQGKVDFGRRCCQASGYVASLDCFVGKLIWVNCFNTYMYNAAGVSRRQHQNVTNFVNNFNILEFGYYIWNPHEKCIQKSPNMPGIG